jgi:excisionase family DNA binding protein
MSRSQLVKDFLTVVQAAKRLGISRAAVLMAIKQGKLKAVRIGHIKLLARKAVDQYKKSRKIGRRRKRKV